MKSSFLINGRTVGKGAPCYVIAEAGVNHNCDVQLGYKLVETAGASGADAIKFQSYTAGKIATRVAPRYWFEPADPKGTQWDSFDKLDKLSDRDFKSLLGHARHVGLTAFSTPFDDEAVGPARLASTCPPSRSRPPTSPATASSSARPAWAGPCCSPRAPAT
jgi:sialic acid synthase SpsE